MSMIDESKELHLRKQQEILMAYTKYVSEVSRGNPSLFVLVNAPSES